MYQFAEGVMSLIDGGENRHASKNVRIFMNTIDIEEQRIAIVENSRLVELFIERLWDRQKTGEIYKARVDNILPGMNAAFVNLGDGRNAFLYLSELPQGSLKQGDELVVQIARVARKNKGARVTTKISLPGRYVVLTPNNEVVGVSKRIFDETERERLKDIAMRLRPQGHGLIVRTVAEGVDENCLAEDIEQVMKLWEMIEHQSKLQKAPCLLYQDLGLIGRVLRDYLNENVSEIIVDNPEDYERVKEFVRAYSKGKFVEPEVKLYTGTTPLFEYYSIEQEVKAALEKKVWLSSGGYITIDQTEALTAIDVNTGKYIGSAKLRDTVFKINIEAASEIAQQLRLRAIGGIIVIDFIDMKSKEDKERLIEYLSDLFKGDREKARIFGITELGLVEITRRRSRSDLKSLMTRGCPFCGGRGWVLREEAIAMDIKRFIRKVIRSSKFEAIVIDMNDHLAKYINDTFLKAWESEFGKKIILRGFSDYSWGKYKMVFQGSLSQAKELCLKDTDGEQKRFSLYIVS